MSFQNIAIVLPSSCTLDVHVCGSCKTLFYSIENFMEHKIQVCPSPVMTKKTAESIQQTDIAAQMVLLSDSQNFGKSVIVKNEPVILKNGTINGENLITKSQKEEFQEVLNSLVTNSKVADIEAMHDNLPTNLHESDIQEKDSLSGGIMSEVESPLLGKCRGKMRPILRCSTKGCKFSTFFKKDLERHVRIHTGERPFTCFMCNKMFTRNDKLMVHQRIHSGDRKYKCSQCGYAAVESSSLIKHLRIHNGQRPFKCQLCPYRARESSQLTVHLRMHTGDSPFVCVHDKCKAAFKTNSDLKRHMVIHSGNKAHPCPYCPFRSAAKDRMKRHVEKLHPNEQDGVTKPHICPHCPNTTFDTVRKLNNHLKIKHFVVSPTDEKTTYKRVRRKKVKPKDIGEEIATMNRDHKCEQCHASFVCPESLRVHLSHHLKTKKVDYRESNCDRSVLSSTNLEGTLNMRTAELLASLAVDMLPRSYDDVASDLVPDQDFHKQNDGIKFIDPSLL